MEYVIPFETEDYVAVKFETEKDWLANRRLTIGASDVAAVFDRCPWTTRQDLYREKRGELEHKLTPSSVAAIQQGKMAEAPVRELYAINKRVRVLDGTFIQFTSKRYPWLSCTLDGIIIDEAEKGYGDLEIKNARWDYAKWGGQFAPWHYAVQVLQQLLVTGFPYAYLYARLTGKTDSWGQPEVVERRFKYRAADYREEMAVIVRETKAFYEQVTTGKYPTGYGMPAI